MYVYICYAHLILPEVEGILDKMISESKKQRQKVVGGEFKHMLRNGEVY